MAELLEAEKLVEDVGLETQQFTRHYHESLNTHNKTQEYHKKYYKPLEWEKKLKDVEVLLLDARIHNKNIRELAKRLYQDIKDIRGVKDRKGKGAVTKRQLENVLTKDEAFILIECNNLNGRLNEVHETVKKAISIPTSIGDYDSDAMSKSQRLGNLILDIRLKIKEVINTLYRLFYLEKQVEVATKKYIQT